MKVDIKKYFADRKKKQKSIRNGSYSMGMTVIVIAIVIIINLVVQELPVEYREIDLSETKLYSIGDQTKDMLDDLEEDVYLYLIAESGYESVDIQNLLERYDSYSEHIIVETKDPVTNPNFTSQYTQETVEDNSVLVVCGERSKLVTYSNMLETSVDYTTYSTTVTGFDGEGQITSAIDYVTSENLPTLYVVEGHNEMALSESAVNRIQKENISIESLNLLAQETVPEDADCVLIYSPTSDFSSEEAEKMITYLENGGKSIIISSLTQEKLPNFLSIVENYGVTLYDGLIVEGNADYYISQTPYYLLPEIEDTDITSSLMSEGRYVLTAYAQGIQIQEDVRNTITIESLLTTSDDAYSKVNINDIQTFEKEEGDIEGPFPVGVSIKETLDEGKETQIVFYTTDALLDENADAMVSGSNVELFTSSLSWMCESEPSISIASKDITLEYLTIPAADMNLWTIVSVVVLPVFVLVTGGMIWFRRRKQ